MAMEMADSVAAFLALSLEPLTRYDQAKHGRRPRRATPAAAAAGACPSAPQRPPALLPATGAIMAPPRWRRAASAGVNTCPQQLSGPAVRWSY